MPRPFTEGWRWRASLVLMAASGFAGLGYQIVWTQQAALWLGHESAAVLAVVAAFFGGLAAGAFAFGPRIERSARPAYWYAACEGLVGLWGLVLLVLMAPFSAWVLGTIGEAPAPGWQWLVAFASIFVLLLPATAAMGATLPAIERATALHRGVRRSIAPHYASNTIGAVVGVLATAFWLIPELGLARTTMLCVALNPLCAAASLACLPHDVGTARTLPPAYGARDVLVRLLFTGLLGIGYEVLVVRVLSEVTEDTVYTFAMLLAVYLAGSAIGAAVYQRWCADGSRAERLGDRLLGWLAAACLIGMGGLWAAEWIKTFLLKEWGTGMTAAVAAEATLAVAAFALPTLVMGALFSHLSARAMAAGANFGQALGFNTLGASAAPLLFGVVLTPLLGPKSALLLIVAGYLALTARAAWLKPTVLVPAGVALALAASASPLAFVDVPEGGHVVSYEDGVMAAVSVVEDDEHVARLRIDNRQQEGSSATRFVDGRQALLPLLLHPAPRRALFLGLGTGVAASTAAADPHVEIDAVELLPEVITASRHFTGAVADHGAAPRLHPIAADARRYVRATTRRYDVIVADNFHPARSGSGALYTVEHFQAVKDSLAAGGLFCQWLPLHQLDLDTLRSSVQSFVAIYPDGRAILASNSLETPVLGLVGGRTALRFDPAVVRDRVNASTGPRPADFGIDDAFALLGSFVAGPDALVRFAAGAPLNSDDRPVVADRAPRITYAPESLPRERLTALLNALSIVPDDVVVPGTSPDFARRLAAYWSARDLFIAAGQSVRPSTNVVEMLAQVRAPLLTVPRPAPISGRLTIRWSAWRPRSRASTRRRRRPC